MLGSSPWRAWAWTAFRPRQGYHTLRRHPVNQRPGLDAGQGRPRAPQRSSASSSSRPQDSSAASRLCVGAGAPWGAIAGFSPRSSRRRWCSTPYASDSRRSHSARPRARARRSAPRARRRASGGARARSARPRARPGPQARCASGSACAALCAAAAGRALCESPGVRAGRARARRAPASRPQPRSRRLVSAVRSHSGQQWPRRKASTAARGTWAGRPGR
jgi:hypothetical protein